MSAKLVAVDENRQFTVSFYFSKSSSLKLEKNIFGNIRSQKRYFAQNVFLYIFFAIISKNPSFKIQKLFGFICCYLFIHILLSASKGLDQWFSTMVS